MEVSDKSISFDSNTLRGSNLHQKRPKVLGTYSNHLAAISVLKSVILSSLLLLGTQTIYQLKIVAATSARDGTTILIKLEENVALEGQKLCNHFTPQNSYWKLLLRPRSTGKNLQFG
jgi:hypothetical protein